MRQGGGGYGASSPRLRAFLLGRSLFVAKEMVVVVRLVELVAVVVVQVNTGLLQSGRAQWPGPSHNSGAPAGAQRCVKSAASARCLGS